MSPVSTAISESINYNKIIRLYDCLDLCQELSSLSDGEVETESEYEFWGTDTNGNAWRIHIKK